MTQDIQTINAYYSALFSPQYRLVPGEGNNAAQMVLVGEAPGAQEAEQGRPFVGAAGKNLDTFLLGIGLARQSLYITNAVKFRPTKESAKGRLSNRTPTRAEVDQFRPWLRDEIVAVAPTVIVTLGNTALRAVIGWDAPVIGDIHGEPQDTPWGTVFPLYHPASIIYRRALIDTYDEDLRRLSDFIHAK